MDTSTKDRKGQNPIAPQKADVEAFMAEVIACINRHGTGAISVLRQVMVAMDGVRTVEARRELVLELIGVGTMRSRIIMAVKALFKNSAKTIDEDIRWAKDWYHDHANGKRRDEIKARVEMVNETVIRKGLATGNLAAANRANTLRAVVNHLADPNMSTGDGGGETNDDVRRSLESKLDSLIPKGDQG